MIFDRRPRRLARHLACSNSRALRLAAALLLLLSLVWSAPGHAGGNTSIFVLHSYSQEYPWTKRQHEGFLRALGAGVADTISVSVEYLDTKRVPYSAAYADSVAAHLAQKYAGFEPKLIYVTDDNALLFALDHLTRIFPKTPIIFSGINDYYMKQRIDPRQVTGVFEEKEIAPNLELMRHLAPWVRDILVVGDESETFQAIRREIARELEHQPDIHAQFLSSSRIDLLVASLQGHTEQFVFLTTLGAMTDAMGHTLTLPETIAAIAQAGRFIIISMEDVYLYPGVLGGYVTSGYKQGAAAAEMGARYLAGTAIADIKPIESSPNEYIIDGAELEKLSLTLPAGIAAQTTIVNAVPTFYERHLRLIVHSLYAFTLLFVASLAASIYALMRKNQQIARSSKNLQEQTELMKEVQESLVEAQRIAGIGSWEWLSADDTITWSEGLNVILARDPTLPAPTVKSLQQFFTPEGWKQLRAAVAKVIETGTPFELELEMFRDDRTTCWTTTRGEAVCTAEGAVVKLRGTVHDIEGQKRAETVHAQLEAQLRESQKMEALGTLAGGVAHDFNNALATIIGNAELARQDVGPAHAALESLEEIGKASRRAKDLVQQILAFGRRQTLERKATSLALVVVETARLVRATLPGTVSLSMDCAADTPAVLADATQVKQILLNLYGNALQAVQDQGRPGVIEIRLHAYEHRQGEAHGDLRPGRYACLSVRDNGAGMDEATRARIFEPFFTTKPRGKGTGLGLSVVHGIVQAHQASIEVKSAPREGSEFRIYFPAVAAPVPDAMAPAPDTTPVHGNGKHILYLDDEDAIIFLMTRLLERQGYRVSGYTDPRDALAAARARPDQFDLVVTDYNMPGMSGLDVACALKEIRADLPVVLASGYITEELRAKAPAAGVRELIYKPNTVEDLCDAVARLANKQQ